MTTPNHNGSYDDPPPSYDSLFKNVATKRAEGAGVLGCTREVTKAYQSKMPGIVNLVLCGICGSLVGFALPLSELVIGSLYFELCPAEDRLPVFLVVSGVVGMVTTSCCCGLMISFSKHEDDEEVTGKETCATCWCTLFTIFLFVWLICGSTWAFRMKECDEANTLPVVGPTHDCFTKNVSHVGDSHYCKALLFNFVYFETIAKWVSFGLVPFVLFIFAGFVVCGCMCVKEATTGSAAERNETCSSRV